VNKPVAGTPFSFADYSGREGLARIKADWKRLASRLESARFFHLYEWYWSYVESLELCDTAMHFFIAYRDGEPMAVFPLRSGSRVRLGMRFRFLELPQHPQLPLADFIGEQSDMTRGVLNALLSYLGESREDSPSLPPWDYIVLQWLLADSCAVAWIDHDRPSRALLQEAGKSNSIVLPSSYSEIEKTFSKNFRGDLRKARNKLNALPGVEVCSTRDRATLETLFEEFLEVESSGWKGTGGTATAIKLHPEELQFYRNLIATFAALGGCEINLLRADGKCIAGQFCLRVGDTYYVLKIGYDESRSRLAPGNMLLERLLQRLTAEGAIKAVSLVTSFKWHDNWKPHSDRTFNAQLFRHNTRGRLLWRYKNLRRRRALVRAGF